MKLPTIKKKISAFMTKEDGKISKHSLLALGALMASIGLAHNQPSDPSGGTGDAEDHPHRYEHANIIRHVNNEEEGRHYAEHANHGSHVSHASHGSHGSHGSW